MKKLIFAATFILLASTGMSQAAVSIGDENPIITKDTANYIQEAKRGRGRGGDDNRSESRSDDRGGKSKSSTTKSRSRSSDDNGASGSGRKKPRVPGGSGCDDAGDVAEHAECGGAAAGNGGGTVTPGNTTSGSKRRKPRVPGGSGCDDPGDIAEHPECRV
jgi:hypothetical protein